MKWHIAAVVLVVGAAVVLMAGCPKQTGTEVAKTETTVQPSEPPTATPGEAKTTEPAGAEEVKQLLQERCTQCHTTERIKKEKAEADAEEWGKIVKQMQANAKKMKKTPITDEEAAKILDYVINAPAL